jgi:uncharacterized protein YbcV (DUF1398 family)
MFTLDQIKAAHSKVKSGADFPAYIQELIGLGLKKYESFVADGHTVYHGAERYSITSEPGYDAKDIVTESNKEQFIADLKEHQQGKTDYATFCSDCAKNGVEKWIVDMEQMTCTYYDKRGNEILEEQIPTPLNRE